MEIYDYMVQRAKFEKLENEVPLLFYVFYLGVGCRTFFNVTVDAEGNVLRDDENIEFFKLWKQRNRKRQKGKTLFVRPANSVQIGEDQFSLLDEHLNKVLAKGSGPRGLRNRGGGANRANARRPR